MTLPEIPQQEGEVEEGEGGEEPAQKLQDPFSIGEINLEAGTVEKPDLGVGAIIRTHIFIHEHSKTSGGPCANLYAVEVLFPEEGKRLVCDSQTCLKIGVMEALE